MDLKEICHTRNWIDLAQNRDNWRAYVRAVMNLQLGLLKSQFVSYNESDVNNILFLGSVCYWWTTLICMYVYLRL